MLVSGAIDAGLGRVALMPLVVLAARLCPKVLLTMQHSHSTPGSAVHLIFGLHAHRRTCLWRWSNFLAVALALVSCYYRCVTQGVEATVFGTLISLHIASHITGKILGSALTVLFGVTSSNFTNLGLLMLVRMSLLRPMLAENLEWPLRLEEVY